MVQAGTDMENDFAAVDGHIDEYRMLGLHQPDYSTLNNARHSLKELQKALDVLPKDLSNPDLDWGLLKILFDQKDQAHEKATKELKSAEYILGVVEREVGRCRNNLSALDRDMKIVKTPGTKLKYSETINTYAQQYKKSVEQKNQTMLVFTALKAAIRESNSRQFPRDSAAVLPRNSLASTRYRRKLLPSSNVGKASDSDAIKIQGLPAKNHDGDHNVKLR
jgi:hypothetical protein